ncbi:sigma-70 family RNA polymerase sigma factor [Streptomyces pratensis]|uniref:sigma-70 family RNA polymerase sigma factor n=1 Tax=Streptomyces pratensis TaxID=1169025 RepID=UPI0036263650
MRCQGDEVVHVRPQGEAGNQPGSTVVTQARAGDPRALDALVAGYLPLVYNVVGRAMDGHRDVDDVVQETMIRAVHGLPDLRDPERFRSWLIAIAVRQVRDWWRGNKTRPQPGLPDDSIQQADPQADFADVTVLRLELSGQRLEATEATRWLEDEERETLSLWWMEAAGELSRAELAEACDLTPHHATVRVQRVKDRLDAARAILRALASSPRCTGLDDLLPSWDGRPSALWRKRLHRHIRDCHQCRIAASGLVPAEGLLGGLGLVPLPIGLAAHVLSALSPAATAATVTGGASGGAVVRSARRALSRSTRALSRGPVAATSAVATLLLTALAGWYVFDLAGMPAGTSTSTPHSVSAPTPPPSTAAPADEKPPSPSPSAEEPTSPATPKPDSPECGGLAKTWASWRMPNARGGGLPNPASYTDLGNGTVRDNVTCLVWQQDAAAGTYTFSDAKQYCADLDLAGGGWHLPSRIELTSIVDTTRSGPAIDPTAFPGTPVQFFWTSSPWAVTKEPLRAWIVNFYEGLASNGAFQSGKFWARCVQSEEGKGRPAYRVAGGEVTDPATGLTWQREPSSATMTADAATVYCQGLRLGGHSWRLPGIKELATTVDEARVSPAVDPTAFPDTAEDAWYWTASKAAPDATARWALNYNDGYTKFKDIPTGFARCVR